MSKIAVKPLQTNVIPTLHMSTLTRLCLIFCILLIVRTWHMFLVAQDENHSNIWKSHSFTVFEDAVYIQALHGSHAQSQPECWRQNNTVTLKVNNYSATSNPTAFFILLTQKFSKQELENCSTLQRTESCLKTTCFPRPTI